MADPLHALVVEDSPTMRQLICFALRRIKGLEVVEADDGVDGLKKLSDSRFDILITDINMPVMDGLKLVSLVRKDEIHKDIPIVIITTEGAAEDRQRAIRRRHSSRGILDHDGGIRFGDRPELEAEPGDDAQGSERSREQSRQAVPGHVLHDLGTPADDPPVPRHDHDFEHSLPGRAVAEPPPSRDAGRDHATQRGGRLILEEHCALAPLVDLRLEAAECHSSARDDSQIVGLPVLDLIQPRRCDDDIGRDPIAEPLMQASSPGKDRQSML